MESIAFVWDNFGPTHVDRCEAVAKAFGSSVKVVGLELFSESDTYGWVSETGSSFRKITVFPGGSRSTTSAFTVAARIVSLCRKEGLDQIFLCHYDYTAILMAAAALRLLGRRVYAMADSKFDDYQRRLWREVAKSAYYLPYQGGISCKGRAGDYMRFLGLPAARIVDGYDTLSIERIRRLAEKPPAPGGMDYSERHFTIVARFVPKKNLKMALAAYALYRQQTASPRALHLCGSGPLEAELRAQVSELGLKDSVVFHGFVQTAEIARILADSVALILPSIEEQFGLVTIEAQAMGLPVILSDNCGSRDDLVRSGVNGFVIEPDNPQGLAFFMTMLGEDRDLWTRLSVAASQFAERGDVGRFVDGIATLTGRP